MNKSDFNEYFEHMFNSCKQTSFEDWFTNLAECIWGTDFEVVKAGGQHGDKKSDGRRISIETVYQCYAPESPATFAKNAPSKIRDSFPEVINYWPNLKEWVFVHNNLGGITTNVSDTLEAIRAQYPNITISSASRRFLKDDLHDKMSMQQMLDVYPKANLNFSKIEMEHVRPLLKRIIREKTTPVNIADFGEIPNEAKLDYNNFSPDAKFDLQRARPNIAIVDRFIASMSNPDNASVIQTTLQCKYCELKDLGYDVDEILGKLLSFVRIEEQPTQTAAAYVILAYYFDACDIFENAPENITC